MNTRKTRLINITMLVARSALYLHVRKVTRFCFEKEAQLAAVCRSYIRLCNLSTADSQCNLPFAIARSSVFDRLFFKQKHNTGVCFLTRNGFEIVARYAVVGDASNFYVRLLSLTSPSFLIGSLSRRNSRALKQNWIKQQRAVTKKTTLDRVRKRKHTRML